MLGMYTSVAVAVVVAALVWAWALGVRRSRRRKRQGKDRICPLLPPLTAEEVEVLPGMVVGLGRGAQHCIQGLQLWLNETTGMLGMLGTRRVSSSSRLHGPMSASHASC